MSQSSNPTSSKEKSDASLDLQVEELLKPPEKLPLTSSPLDGEPETHFPQFGEKDYHSHRSEDVLVHHQLEPLPQKGSAKSLRDHEAQQQKIRTSHSNKSFAEATEELITSIAEENIGTDSVDGGEKSAPKFTIGEEDGTEAPVRSDSQSDEKGLHAEAGSKFNEKPGSHKHHRHHHSHSKKQRNLSADPNERLRQGSEVNLKMHDISIKIGGDDDEEEEGEMNPSIRETMAVHRLGDMSGGGRHHHSSHKHNVSSFVHVRGRRDSGEKKKSPKQKKEYDHRPHEVFVELDELYKEEGHEMQWKEKARWIKYEEDVEEGAQRWGKPHVASLSFHSLVELRQYLEHATALFDLEETNLSTIFHRIVDSMISADQIKEENRGDIMRALLLKHKHVNDGSSILRNFSTISLGSMDDKKGDRHNEKHHHHHSGIFKNLSSISLSGHGQTKPEAEVHIPMINADGKPNTNGMPNDNQNASTVGFKTTPSSTSLMKLAHKLDNSKIEGIMRKIPHDAEVTSALVGEVDFLDTPAVSFVRLAEGAVLDNFSEVPIPVRFLFVMLVPTHSDINYHELGRSFSTLMSNDHFHETAYRAETMRDLLTAMNTFIDHTIVLPPGDWDRELLLPVLRMQNEKMKKMRKAEEEEEEVDGELTVVDFTTKKHAYQKFPDPLKRTGKIFGGLINDVRRRYPHYWSDIKDGLNFQCVAAFFFIFFAALSPAITFGGLLADKTENWLGVSETIIATAINGCIFALFSGQPLNIIGVTGPILVFEENLYSFCTERNIEYLPFRVWVGIWLFVIITVMVAFEGSVLVQYFTRFTEEIFAFLIGLIFIYEVFNKLYKIFQAHPLLEDYCTVPGTDGPMNYTEIWTTSYTEYTNENGTVMYDLVTPAGNMTDGGDCAAAKVVISGQPNTALLSTILTLGTFFLAYFLRKFRQGRFLGRSARKMIGDFGIPISILVFVMVDFFIKATYTQKLDVPDGLKPSDICKRGWFVNPLGIDKPLGIGLMFGAAIPALLAFILMYMETLITGLIVNKKDNKLKKGSGYHLDMFLLGCMAVWNGLLGLPLVWAATVRSVTHIGALSVFSKSHAPGEKPKLIKILEQRITGFFIHVVIGASIAISPLLRQVPLAVLFGVFLYMGVTSLNGIQMVERCSLLLMPVKHHPDTRYVREVRTWRMHVFTIIQLACLGILWIIKLTPAALAFSFFLILLVPIRSQLKRFFTKHELEALDSDEVDANEDEDDEYQTVHMPQ